MKICVVGLGYVGLPLAVNFGKLSTTYGFDISQKRIEELKQGIDSRNELSAGEIKSSDIVFSSDPKIIKECDFLIIGVPTPVDDAKIPDLSCLISASKIVGQNLKKGSIVVYESTVYPGCTENDCVPVLEKESGLKCGADFKVGYSPERINPGDIAHSVGNVVKVVSGMDEESLNIIAGVYSKIIKKGVFKASSIKVAEASKVIENTQRDINIALMNELKMIFDKMNIDWKEVIEASSTKWNFVPYKPGLVGGHCIGVDPYYLAFEAEKLGHHPEIILAGRRINDNMAKYEAGRLLKHMINQGMNVKGSEVLVLGGTFKPDVTDTRNSKVEDFIAELKSFGCSVDIHEPNFKQDELFGCKNIEKIDSPKYDLVVKTVNHAKFKDLKFDYGILL